MHTLRLDDSFHLNIQIDGDPAGAPIVFANSLSTDLRLWDGVVAALPPGLRILRYDMRGHGLSACPPAPYSMGALIRDAERLIEAHEITDCVFVGLSIGGMVAQGLAAKRLDLVRAVVLSNTAPKIGTREMWQDRIDAVEETGTQALAGAILERWFSKPFRESPSVDIWRRMVEVTPDQGYAGCAAAIAGTDLLTQTAGLRLPALVIAGSEDGSTPPDLVREMADRIPGAQFELMRGAGHLPCVEDPNGYAALLASFLRAIGHLPA